MNQPALSRAIETFIPVRLSTSATAVTVWQDYLDVLRTTVAPLVTELYGDVLIQACNFDFPPDITRGCWHGCYGES